MISMSKIDRRAAAPAVFRTGPRKFLIGKSFSY
jgi:hypothetical protein